MQSKSINDPLYINHTLCVDVKSAVKLTRYLVQISINTLLLHLWAVCCRVCFIHQHYRDGKERVVYVTVFRYSFTSKTETVIDVNEY